jgi:hypothetical protein
VRWSGTEDLGRPRLTDDSIRESPVRLFEVPAADALSRQFGQQALSLPPAAGIHIYLQSDS